MNRISVINTIIDHTGARAYLEIGVKQGLTFMPRREQASARNWSAKIKTRFGCFDRLSARTQLGSIASPIAIEIAFRKSRLSING